MIKIYVTIIPIILAGVSNMVFTKTNIYKAHSKPIDCGKLYKDNRHILGNNKTFIGFASMVIFSIFWQVLWGLFCNYSSISHLNNFYLKFENTFVYNALIGTLLGFTYMVCELPNSFIKRRINILPGKTNNSPVGILFFFVDQFDSVLGIGLVIFLLSGISVLYTIAHIIIGGLTHVIVNLILLMLKIRKNL